MRTFRSTLSLAFVAQLLSFAAHAQPLQMPSPPAAVEQPAQMPAPAPSASQPPAPVQVPPPPAAPAPYPYVHPEIAAQRAAISNELAALDARLFVLQRDRAQHGIGGPIAMMACGYAAALLFTTVGLVEWSVAEEIEGGNFDDFNQRHEDDSLYDGYFDHDERYDLNEDGLVDGDDERQARRVARTFAGLTAVGLGVGIAGTVLLTKALAKRREYDPELGALRSRRNVLMRSLQWGGGYSQSGPSLTLSGRF